MLRIGSSNQNKVGLLRIGVYCLPPFLISFLFRLLSSNEILWVQWILAFVLLQIPWLAYLNWKRRADEKIPVFALISFLYWVYFALALFWGARTPSGVETPFEKEVPQEAVTWSLAMVVTGVCAVWVGMRVRLSNYLVPQNLPELRQGPSSTHYLRFILVSATLLGLLENLPYIAGEGGRQALTILTSWLPLLAFSILFRTVLIGVAAPIDNVLVLGFLGLRFVVGLSSGWLGAFAAIIIVCAGIYVSEKRKIPRSALILVVLFTLFFQVGKQEFRRVYWTSDTETSKMDRVKFWTETSMAKWEEALSDPTGGALAEAVNLSLSRISLLTQTANVIDLTPSTIPYQQGRLYSYLLFTWVPRAVWPDKPSMNEANQFYQVAYGISTEEAIESVSIGVGVLTEAYISFGWYGVIGIMFLMGILYDIYRKICFSSSSGMLMTGFGIALLPQLIAVESQMAAYLGGIAQQVAFTLLFFIPVIRWRSQSLALGWTPLYVRSNVRTLSIVKHD